MYVSAHESGATFLDEFVKGKAITAITDPQTKEALKVVVVGTLKDPQVLASIRDALATPDVREAFDPIILRASIFVGVSIALGIWVGFKLGKKS